MRAFSRFRSALLAAALLTAAGMPSRAQDVLPPGVASEAATPPADETREARLDRLFAELRREPDAEKATAVANQIQGVWLDSGSATVDLLMERAGQAVARKDAGAALDLVDQAIVLQPDYAEAYNRRATLHYTQNRYALSIADVEETLRREPRHFGALTGLGAMLEELGRKREALEAYTRALTLYPTLKAAQDAAARIAEEMSGEPA
ncbi:tetratricopeptide repeat protein [Aureimonas sp. SK2]|uniref:tetratricopeptide repeat protein n=1 Tax=Aureimonas sp. SK2 TaxID=3015992 RepID=UPI00244423EE|nr:tetratricopeptide repeat protein [Aureimonas sp. SK2]